MYKLAKLEKERGDLHYVIPQLLNEKQSQKDVADELEISPSTLSVWLSEHGYVVRRVWVRDVTRLEGVA